MAVIEARHVAKRFVLHRQGASSLKERFLDLAHWSRRQPAEEFWALRDVSLTIDRGDALGLVGRNGSGKSTLLKVIAGIHTPTGGQLLVPRGARIGTIIELGVGFHGELSGRENVFLNAAIQGLSRAETERIYPEVVEYSGLAHFMDVPLKTFSSGMHMRLGFAIAAMLRPDILLLDEVFAVGDEDFQLQCMQTMREFRERGTTVIFVSHSPAAVTSICQRVCVLDRGEVLFDGAAADGIKHYHGMLRAAHAQQVDGDRPAPSTGVAEDQLDKAWHRLAVGGRWHEAGDWQFDFLRKHGLAPAHYALDVGCGSLAGGTRLIPFLEPDHYWGIEIDRALFNAGVTVELARAGIPWQLARVLVNDTFDLSQAPQPFQVAIANSFFRRLPLNRIARCIASVMPTLVPGGRFFATWIDNPYPGSMDSMTGPDGTVSHPDAEPFHYSFDVLKAVCESLGYQAERLPDAAHPRGESVMVITAGLVRR